MVDNLETRPLRQHGIFRNLPTYDPSIKGLSAIVTGANGITGFHVIRALLSGSGRWSKIYALSRSPLPQEMMLLLDQAERSKVQHISVDFQSSPRHIADILANNDVSADYVFYSTYLQPRPPPNAGVWTNAEELVRVNADMLDNFLSALRLMKLWPKRLLLQTGAKNYGVHIGRARLPAFESDQQPKLLEPNFYYAQETLLFEYCKESGGKTAWNVIMPAWIIGAVARAQINGFYPLGVYAAVQAHRRLPMQFPSDWSTFQHEYHHSTAFLTGFLSEWAVLSDECANQRFNAQDTSPASWDRIYEDIARWYSVEKGVVGPPSTSDADDQYLVIRGKSGREVPFGHGPGLVHRVTFSFIDWARQEENRKAWVEIMEASNGTIKVNPFDDPEGHFLMCDATHGKLGALSMNKARMMGWNGFVDTSESLYMMFDELSKIGLLPPVTLDGAKP